MSSEDRVEKIERTKEWITDEFEINSLEKKLADLENKYEELETNWQSNFKLLAMKKVDLVVAKELRDFAEDMLDRKRAIIVDEKRKLDDLHWQVWNEERKICTEISKCLADNNSVNFLNKYPAVLESEKYSFTVTQESDEEIRKAIEENPEIEKLSTEIVRLETEVKKAEDNCWQETLDRVLAELDELKRLNPANNRDETKRLIEALEYSHRERMSLEAEIADIEYTTDADVNFRENKQTKEYDEKPEDMPRVKIEKKEATLDDGSSEDKKWLVHTLGLKPLKNVDAKLDKKQDEKLKAKEWYGNYAFKLAVTEREKDIKNCYTTLSQGDISAVIKPDRAVEPSASVKKCSESELKGKKNICIKTKGGITEGTETVKRVKFSPKYKIKTASKPRKRITPPTRSHFFGNEESDPEPENASQLGPPRPKISLEHPNEPGNSRAIGLLERIPKPKRKFESLVATPSTFLKSVAETTVDKNLVQSNYTETGATLYASIHGNTEKAPKRRGKFTPKTPSNIRKDFMYRQTKLDEFHKFMLSDVNQ